ncbi:diacylglycerol kinase family lipid kinase [bacterium]|nr:MAG: diacylglycerol kinase family lipid kinase [bacterium]
MKAIFIINPKSSGGKTGKSIQRLKQIINKSFTSFSIAETTEQGHATELTKEAIREGYEHIFSVGGDGTLNEVVNGYLENDKPINPNVILSILPSGTGGDFRKNFGLTSDLEKSLVQIQNGNIYQVDAGRCELRDAYGFKIVRYFNNVGSLGLSDYVAEKVNNSKWRKKLGGTAAFLISGVQGILAHKPETVRITSDGMDMGEYPLNLLAVANGKYFAGGMKVAPHAQISDGEFDVILLSDLSVVEMLMNNSKVYYGGHVKHPKVKQFRTKSITIETAHHMRIELDGETPGILPATLTCLPGVLRFKA